MQARLRRMILIYAWALWFSVYKVQELWTTKVECELVSVILNECVFGNPAYEKLL